MISVEFVIHPTAPNTSDGNLYPNFLLGLPSSYSQGSAQDELVRSTSVYLFAQDSWKIKPSVTLELWTALGGEHSAQRYRAESSDIPAGTEFDDLPLHVTDNRSAIRSGERNYGLQFSRRNSNRLGISWRQRRSDEPDQHLLEGFCAKVGLELEPNSARRGVGQDHRRTRQDERYDGLGNVLQPD